MRLQLQSQRIDSVSDSIQQMRQEAADNTKLLHDMIVNMENLGESVRNMQNEFVNWGTGETEMEVETEEDRLHGELQKELLQEVSSAFPHIPNTGSVVTPSSATPSFIQIPTPSVSVQSGPSLPSDADQQMRKRFEDLKNPAVPPKTEKLEKQEKQVSFNFDTPTSSPPWYPGLDGHPRRIMPTPISLPFSTSFGTGINVQSPPSDPDRHLTFEEEVEQMRKRNEAAMAKYDVGAVNVDSQKSVKIQKTVEHSVAGTGEDNARDQVRRQPKEVQSSP